MLNIILFGAPGTGKGTQSPLLVEKYGLIHISTGDLFRYEISQKTKLGLEAKSFMDAGRLVPDEVTLGLFQNKLEAHPKAKGFIFDGFPRTVAQAEALDKLLTDKNMPLNAFVELAVPENLLIDRLLGRGEKSGRADDSNELVIKKRLAVYQQETAVVANYYQQKNKAHQINGVGSVQDIFERLCDILETL
jgi:adenylate kinase